MLKEIDDKGLIIMVDKELTEQIHRNPKYYVCECAYCRNYNSTVIQYMPTSYQELLQELGIEILKPSEAVEYGQPILGTSHYIVDYHFIGKLLDDKYAKELNTSISDYAYFPNDTTLASKEFDHHDVVCIRINILLPWVIDEPYE